MRRTAAPLSHLGSRLLFPDRRREHRHTIARVRRFSPATLRRVIHFSGRSELAARLTPAKATATRRSYSHMTRCRPAVIDTATLDRGLNEATTTRMAPSPDPPIPPNALGYRE